MAIAVECPSCEYAFSVPDGYAGKRGKCPKCETVFRAPTRALPKQTAPAGDRPVSGLRPVAKPAEKKTGPSAKPKKRRRPLPETPATVSAEHRPVASTAEQSVPPDGGGAEHSVQQERGPTTTTRASRRYSNAPLVTAVVLLALLLLVSAVAVILLNPLGPTAHDHLTEKNREPGPRQRTTGAEEADIQPTGSEADGSPAAGGDTPPSPAATELKAAIPPEFGVSLAPPLGVTTTQEAVMSADIHEVETEVAPGSLGSVDRINELHDRCKEKGWAPATAEDYESFQELALHVAIAQLQADDERVNKGLRVIVNSAAEEVLRDLSTTRWPDEARIASANQLALDELNENGQGIFAYVEVAIPSRNINTVEGQPLAVFQLIGTNQSVALPVRENPPDLRKGTRWLLLGVNDSFVEIVLPAVDATGEDEKAKFIRARTLVGRPEPVVKIDAE